MGKRPKLKLPSFLTDVSLDEISSPTTEKSSSENRKKSEEDMELLKIVMDKRKRGLLLQKSSKSSPTLDLKIDGITPTSPAQILNSPTSNSSLKLSIKDKNISSKTVTVGKDQSISSKTETVHKEKSKTTGETATTKDQSSKSK